MKNNNLKNKTPRKDEVRVSTESSFPCSDPPSYWASASKPSAEENVKAEANSSSDWVESSEQDPRMPTAPEFVEISALARAHEMKLKSLIELAIRKPEICKTSSGNPWTESSHESVFLHEKSVVKELQSSKV